MARYEVNYDSNDGEHRWFNCKRVRFGFRWIHARGSDDSVIRIARNRVLSVRKIGE